MTVLLMSIGVGVLADARKAVAGGRSFVALPALMWVGVPPVAGNASSTEVVLPDASAFALGGKGRQLIVRLGKGTSLGAALTLIPFVPALYGEPSGGAVGMTMMVVGALWERRLSTA